MMRNRAIGSRAFQTAISSSVRGSRQIGAHAVLAPTPGHRLDEARAVAGARPRHGIADRAVHRDRVVAVDAHAGNAVGASRDANNSIDVMYRKEVFSA